MANEAMSRANAAPLNSTTSSAISNSSNLSRETNVQVGEVNIQTQATDADGISRDIGGSLSEQLAQLENEFATGVER
jgi:hypothetical protein